MKEELLVALTSIIVLGIGSRWLAWWFRVPAILLLIIAGIVVGPVTHLLDPNFVFKDLLLPIVSISVSIILFEGGLSLKLSEFKSIGMEVINLITLGLLLTWLLASLGAYYLLHLDLEMAILLGAILVVSGPTVIIPLLRQLRLQKGLANLLKWEGILNDPIGALLAVLVFQAILVGGVEKAPALLLLGIFKSFFVSIMVALLLTGVLVFLLKRFLIPEFLHNVATLAFVVGASTLSNLFQKESGLLTVTLMGIILANQKTAFIQHIVEFKENLRVLLISCLFIVLVARLDFNDIKYIRWEALIFLGFLVVIVRPLAVFISTLRSKLSFRERAFVSLIGPRGIVAASVASIFALELADEGYHQAGLLVPIVFFVIIGTVTLSSLLGPLAARVLKLALSEIQGTLIIGGHRWAREIALFLMKEGIPVVLADTNRQNVQQARNLGLPTYMGNILNEIDLEKVNLSSLGRLMALTPNDEVNTLTALRFRDYFGRSKIYQLAAKPEEDSSISDISNALRGRILFEPEITFEVIEQWMEKGATLECIPISDKLNPLDPQKPYEKQMIPIMVIGAEKEVRMAVADQELRAKAGERLLAFVLSEKF